MQGYVFPLFGPSVPETSIVRGFFEGSVAYVPLSGDSAPRSTYLPPASSSLQVLKTSGGSFVPPNSASTGVQIPSTSSPLRAAASAPGKIRVASKNPQRRP